MLKQLRQQYTLSKIQSKSNLLIGSAVAASSFALSHFFLTRSPTTTFLSDAFDDSILLDPPTAIVMYLVRSPDFRWFAFRRMDDEEFCWPPHRILVAIGAVAQEWLLFSVASTTVAPFAIALANLLAPPNIKDKLRKLLLVDNFVVPVLDILIFKNKIIKSLVLPQQNQQQHQQENVSASSSSLRAALLGSVIGVSAYQSLVVLPFGTWKHICLPCFRLLVNRVAPKLPENTRLDNTGATLLFAGLVTGVVLYSKMIYSAIREREEKSMDVDDDDVSSSSRRLTLGNVRDMFFASLGIYIPFDI